MARINKLPHFQKVKVKVKARAGFTFIDPASKSEIGHPLLDDKGCAYTDEKGDVLLFERKTLPNGWSGEVSKTPTVETALRQAIRRGKRGNKITIGTVLVELPVVKEEQKPTSSTDAKDDKSKKAGGK